MMLSVLGAIYGKVIDLRNRFYDKGTFESYDLGARTISIGNITTGGTGKTPLVAYVASILAERGETVCILTRGYGRENPKNRVLVSDGDEIRADARTAGDEPFELAQKLIGKAIVVADADRVAGAEWAKRKFGVTAFVLDDGFQHRRAKRDLDIVCIDATNPSSDSQAGSLRSGKILPAGRLREPIGSLTRAGIVVITRADLVEGISDLRSEISNIAPDAAVFHSENKITNIAPIEDLGKKRSDADTALPTGKAFAFCGIGNPGNFRSMLTRSGVEIVGAREFGDHHAYSAGDIADVEASARNSGAAFLLTTVKDAVKLSDLKFAIPCYVVEIDVEIDDPDKFARML